MSALAMDLVVFGALYGLLALVMLAIVYEESLCEVPASLAAGCQAVAGLVSALAWLYGPGAFAPEFGRLRFPRLRQARHAGRRLSDGERPVRAKAGAS